MPTSKPTKILLIFTIACIAFFALVLFNIHRSMFSTVQVLDSPDDAHRAKLVRVFSIDLNFHVFLDGERIYASPDFAPDRSIPFRETLLWDPTSRFLVLEIAHRRLFGYDTTEQRPLTPDELLALPIPDIPVESLGYSGPWPQEIPKPSD